MFLSFEYSYLGYYDAQTSFDLIYNNFLYAPGYVDDNSAYLREIHDLVTGVLYGCETTISGHYATISEGLVDCGGKIAIPETKVGFKRGTSGYLILGVDKLFRTVDALPSEPHVCWFYYSSDGTTLTINEDYRNDAVQFMKKTVTGQITGITVGAGVTRIYTISHPSVPFEIPGFVSLSIDAGFIATFDKDSETSTTFQISVVQVDQLAAPATLDYSRDGLSTFIYWYSLPLN